MKDANSNRKSVWRKIRLEKEKEENERKELEKRRRAEEALKKKEEEEEKIKQLKKEQDERLERIRLEKEAREMASIEEKKKRDEEQAKQQQDKERKDKEHREKEKMERDKLEQERLEKARVEKEIQEKEKIIVKDSSTVTEHLQKTNTIPSTDSSHRNTTQPQNERPCDTKSVSNPEQSQTEKPVQNIVAANIQTNDQNRDNQMPEKPNHDSKKDPIVSSPIVVRRKPEHLPDSRKEKCISTIEESPNIPGTQDKEKPYETNITSANQALPSTDSRRNTIHGGNEHATADELLQKASQEEQRRKASYNFLKSTGSSLGMDTLRHSGSGITRVRHYLYNYSPCILSYNNVIHQHLSNINIFVSGFLATITK